MRVQPGSIIEFEAEDGRVFSGPVTRVKLHSCDAGNGSVYVKVWFQGQEATDFVDAATVEEQQARVERLRKELSEAESHLEVQSILLTSKEGADGSR